MSDNVDVRIQNHGSVVQFCLFSDPARNWVEENVGLESWQWLGSTFAVDHRFAGDLVYGMQDAGLTVE